MHQRSSYCY